MENYLELSKNAGVGFNQSKHGFEMVLANNRVLSIRLGLKNGNIHIKWHCLWGNQ
jgi:hypothetical protein